MRKPSETPMTVADLIWALKYERLGERISRDTPIAVLDESTGSLEWLTGFESRAVFEVDTRPIKAQTLDREGAVTALVLHSGGSR